MCTRRLSPATAHGSTASAILGTRYALLLADSAASTAASSASTPSPVTADSSTSDCGSGSGTGSGALGTASVLSAAGAASMTPSPVPGRLKPHRIAHEVRRETNWRVQFAAAAAVLVVLGGLAGWFGRG